MQEVWQIWHYCGEFQIELNKGKIAYNYQLCADRQKLVLNPRTGTCCIFNVIAITGSSTRLSTTQHYIGY